VLLSVRTLLVSLARRQMLARSLRRTAALALLGIASVASAEVEWRPTLLGGYSKVFDPHAAFSGALRVQLTPLFYVQPEYLSLVAGDHTDYGPTFQIGISGRSRESLRPFLGFGGGPVKGFAGDDGLFYGALGASYPVSRRHRIFAQGEIRLGLLGETSYSQLAIGIGLSR
jgi:hypothetical protein